ncbi:hypothetical protein [Nereida sp. NH-UV-3]|uniref:hypothetical protein n=1 Tax=Nereida TaxID=282198 RepID=UPI0036F3EEC5
MSPFSLAFKELKFEPISALCYAFALCGVLVPLMVAISLKHGALDQTIEALVTAPQNREIVLQGSHQITIEDIRAYKSIDGLGFVMPTTRPINSQVDEISHKNGSRAFGVEIVPSMVGDPLLEGADLRIGRVFITQSLSDALAASEGNLELRFRRINGAQEEPASFDAVVEGIVRHEIYPRAAVFVHIDDMIKVEAYRDDPSISSQDWYSRFTLPSSFPSMRIYASELSQVEDVVVELKARDLRVQPLNSNVPLMLRLQRGVDLIYGLLAVMGLSGYAVAMAANLRAWTQRRRTDYSLFKLMRHNTAKIAVIPVLQNVMMTFGGFVISILLTLMLNLLVNVTFGATVEMRIAILTLWDVVSFAMALLVVVGLSSLWAVKTIIDVELGEVLTNG